MENYVQLPITLKKKKNRSTTTQLRERPKPWTVSDNTTCWQQELSSFADKNEKWYCHFRGQCGGLIKLNLFLPYDSAIVLLGDYPSVLKTFVHSETCMWMFRANLEATKMFLFRRMDKCCMVWYIQTMKYDSPLKLNELLSYEKTWKNFKQYLIFLKVKEANLKRLHTMWYQLYDILEKAELWR